MGYVSDRLTGIMRVSDLVNQIEAKEMTQEERDLLATEPSLEKANQKWPELSAKATAIFNRAVVQIQEQDRQREARDNHRA